jgi:hypothetical protein
MAAIIETFDGTVGTTLDAHNSSWDSAPHSPSGGATSTTNATLDGAGGLVIAGANDVYAHRNDSQENRSKITIAGSGTTNGTRLTGPAIHQSPTFPGVWAWFSGDDGTNISGLHIGGAGEGTAFGGTIALSVGANNFALADDHTIEIIQVSTVAGVSASVDVYVDDIKLTASPVLVAPNGGLTQGYDGFVAKRGASIDVTILDVTSGTPVVSFGIDLAPSEIRSGNSGLTMDVSNPITVPTVANTTILYNGVDLPVTQVLSQGGGVYRFTFSAGEHASPPGIPYDSSGYILNVTVDGETNETGLIPFLPKTGYGFITLSSVDSSDIGSSPSLVAGDQLDYELVSSPDAWNVSISSAGIMTLSGGSSSVGEDTFSVRAFDSVDNTWGAFTTQTTSVTDAVATVVPTITPTAGYIITLSQGSVYEDPAWTWADDLVTDRAVVWSGFPVDTNASGLQVRTATATNEIGTTTALYSIVIEDAGDPVITITGSQTFTVAIGDSYSDPAWTAYDDNGSLGVVWSGDTVDVNIANVYYRTATATNAVSTTTASYAVTVLVDDGIPTISLLGSNNVSFVVGSSYVEPGYTAFDVVDGDVTEDVVVSGGTVDPNTAGVYVVLYNVSDAAGNAAVQVSRTVTVTSVPVSVAGLTSVQAIESTVYPGSYAVSLVSGAKAQVYCYPNLHDRETLTLWRSGDGGNSYNIPVLMEGKGNILLSTGSNTACIEGPGFFQIRKSDTGSATTIHVDT